MPGRVKINQSQLPVKAHYFFFMAAMGPILPFLPVYGKQLGISSPVMGTITAILPILYLISKPMLGLVVDYFRNWRKMIFISILIGSSLAFVLLYFLPKIPEFTEDIYGDKNFTRSIFCGEYHSCTSQDVNQVCNTNYTLKIDCRHVCDRRQSEFSVTIKFDDLDGRHLVPECLIPDEFDDSNINPSICDERLDCSLQCQMSPEDLEMSNPCLYTSWVFWVFILLFSLGSIGFNVANSISDAICFDVLGEGEHMGYGRQRVWGAIGFGITALLAGYSIDVVSGDSAVKSYTPAFLLVMVFTTFDVISCRKLELPIMSRSESIVKDIFKLLRQKTIAIFLIFATIAGILDSFIIYFLFWYLEDLAKQSHHMHQIKLIEGLIVAAETLGGEVIFFALSGKILKKFGYGYSLTFCFLCYGLRLGLISLVSNPWWVIPIELVFQGPTYALCYTIIVGFASVVAPPGTSATVQGIVAGMDDGFGFAVGSLIGGILLEKIGGVTTIRMFSGLAGITAAVSFFMYLLILRDEMPKTKRPEVDENGIAWKSPEAAAAECQTVDA